MLYFLISKNFFLFGFTSSVEVTRTPLDDAPFPLWLDVFVVAKVDPPSNALVIVIVNELVTNSHNLSFINIVFIFAF